MKKWIDEMMKSWCGVFVSEPSLPNEYAQLEYRKVRAVLDIWRFM